LLTKESIYNNVELVYEFFDFRKEFSVDGILIVKGVDEFFIYDNPSFDMSEPNPIEIKIKNRVHNYRLTVGVMGKDLDCENLKIKKTYNVINRLLRDIYIENTLS
jgi:hypothetical protein